METSDDILDAFEAAAYLKINEQTVRRLARARELPAFKVGGVWRFRRSALEAWAGAQDSAPLTTCRVLLVEDDADVRSVVEGMLAREGFEVVSAADGREALDLMPSVRPELVLLDLAMPRMDGATMLRHLREEWTDVPVIVLTGYPDSDLMTRALDFSPITLLAKPFTAQKLVDTIRLIHRPAHPRGAAPGPARLTTDRHDLLAQRRATMEALGRLAGGVAHDLNNILTGMAAYLQLASGRAGGDARLNASLREIGKLADRAAALTRQLLEIGGRESLRPAPTDVNGLVEGALPSLRRIVGERIEVSFNPAPDLPLAQADPAQIVQALEALAQNARDAMPDGGRLALATVRADLDAPFVAHPEARPGRYVMISVCDSGRGMEADAAARAFEPFLAATPGARDSGLGLAAVYGTVMQHGGHIDIQSAVGGGTTIRLYLPRADATRPHSAEKSLTPEGGCATLAKRARIMVVEDEGPVREVVQHILREEGFDVVAAAGADEAERLFAAHGGAIDLLLTDVVMPGRDGRDLSERLRERRPGLRVLYMSGYTDRAVLRGAAPDGRTPFLQKPFTPDALLRKVAEALGRRP